MHFSKSIKLWLTAIVIWLFSLPAMASDITPTRVVGILLPNGQVLVSTRFNVQLPQQLQDALTQGLPLNFDLSYELERPLYIAYKWKWSHLFDDAPSIKYRLSYHPLTDSYRVSVGTFSAEYRTLDIALKAIGAIANWRILPNGLLKNYKAKDIRIKVQLALSTKDLPQPFRINAFTSKNWNFNSTWVPITLSES